MTEASNFTITTGGIPEASIPAARETWGRQFQAPESATSADAIEHARGQWMARFDDARAAKPGSPTAPVESPEIERAFSNLLALGMTPGAVQEVRTSKAASPAEAEMARVWKAQFMRDTAKQKRYFDGDPEVGKQFLACNFILSLPVKQPAK